MGIPKPHICKLRFECRTLPLPALPTGVSHALSANYYLGRDGRRECIPPVEVYGGNIKALASGENT